MKNEVVNMVIQSGLLAALLALVISGITYGKAWLDAKTKEMNTGIKDKNVKNAISTAEDCVTTAVLEMSQTVADDIKAKSADGKLTDYEAVQIKADALARVKQLIGAEGETAINSIFGDGEAWLISKIEAAVKINKSSSNATLVKVQPEEITYSNQFSTKTSEETAAPEIKPETAEVNTDAQTYTAAAILTEPPAETVPDSDTVIANDDKGDNDNE